MISSHGFTRVFFIILSVFSFGSIAYAGTATLPAGTRVDYSVGVTPLGITFDNVTNSVWVASPNSYAVSKIDINTGNQIYYPYADAKPWDVAFDNVTNSVWVTNIRSNTVSKIAIGAPVAAQHPPALSNLAQFKSDGVTAIAENGITAESTLVFKAMPEDQDADQVKLQVELKESTQSFDGMDLLESGFVASGGNITTMKELIPEGKFHWRARAMDGKGNASEWQEFGIAGNTDFEVKLVPLYTQGFSKYPSEAQTILWFDKLYAAGRGNLGPINQRCGPSIANCGCAVTSMVMLGRYYGINTAVDGSSVDPLAIDRWLTNNNGYSTFGKVYWNKAVDYLGFVDQATNKKMVSVIPKRK